MQHKVATFEGLKSLPASVAILEACGTLWRSMILEAIRSTKRIARSRFAIGSDYLQYCRSDEPNSRRFESELRALLAGKRDLLTFIYPCHSRTQARWFCLIGLPLSLNKSSGVALLHVDLDNYVAASDRCATSASQGREKANSPRGQFSRDWRRPGTLRAGNALVTTEHNVRRSCHAREGGRARERRSDEGRSYSVEQTADASSASAGRGQDQQGNCDGALSFANTIKLHVSAILERLKLRSRAQAALVSSMLWQDRNAEVNAGATLEK